MSKTKPKPTGGTAFPQTVDACGNSAASLNGTNAEGMALRDYFAAKAMAALIGLYTDGNFTNAANVDDEAQVRFRLRLAVLSYRYADAMVDASGYQ